MNGKKVKTVLIASGSGTDADAIMKAYIAGCIPNIEIIGLVSTKEGAECLLKAGVLGIDNKVIDRKQAGSLEKFNEELDDYLNENDTEMVFLVGCIVKVFPVPGIRIYNIHPADPNKYGGNGMYGLEVHRRVMAEIVDTIGRGKADIKTRFYTLPTVHEAAFEYDSGDILLQASVEVPASIIRDYIDLGILDQAASRLQKHVLPYEWLMLPTAVRMAAQKIIDERG